jgi:heptosyltransferase-2
VDAGLVNQVFSIDKKSKDSLREFDEAMNNRSYELLVSPHYSFRTAVMCKKIKAKKRIGFRRWFSRFFYSDLVTRPLDLPDVLRQLSLLSILDESWGSSYIEFVSRYRGSKEQTLASLEDRVMIPDEYSMQLQIDKGFSNPDLENIDFRSSVAIAPGSVWETKKWREEHYVTWAKNQKKKVFVLGSPGEKDLCQKIADQIPGAINLAGKTSLLDLYLVLRKVELLICNDSGTMHMGSVAGVKCISAFGPTTLDIGYRPWSNQALVAQIDLDCRPCGLHGHKKCPIGTHDCMKKLEPNHIEKLASQWNT